MGIQFHWSAFSREIIHDFATYGMTESCLTRQPLHHGHPISLLHRKDLFTFHLCSRTFFKGIWWLIPECTRKNIRGIHVTIFSTKNNFKETREDAENLEILGVKLAELYGTQSIQIRNIVYDPYKDCNQLWKHHLHICLIQKWMRLLVPKLPLKTAKSRPVLPITWEQRLHGDTLMTSPPSSFISY